MDYKRASDSSSATVVSPEVGFMEHVSSRRSVHCRSLPGWIGTLLAFGFGVMTVRLADAEETRAADAARSQALFETHVRPLLVLHCHECHGERGKVQGGLRLDNAQGWLQGGDSGPAVVPGDAAASRIVPALRHEGELQMPPSGRLPDALVERVVEWIESGAHGGGDRLQAEDGEAAPRRSESWSQRAIEEGRHFWAYRPIERPRVPREPVASPTAGESEWGTAVDVWVDRELTTRGLVANPPASRATLARRLIWDLHGLPPTTAEVAEFVHDPAPDAYRRLVDRLLASPRFSERWARHWLDLARYAESLTLRGFVLPEAWRYRDYVVDCFAEDRPYDEFLVEQLAGDLLPATHADGTPVSLERLQQRRIATGFLVLGDHNLEEQDKRQLDMDVVDEQLDVIGRGLLAQTLQCARCHDHKFDPIPTRDYYALAGILRNTQPLDHANVSAWKDLPLPLTADEERRVTEWENEWRELQERINQAKAGGAGATDSLRALQEEARAKQEAGPLRPRALSLLERETIEDAAVHRRGSVHALGEVVPRGVPQVIGPIAPEMPRAESGRRQLASWITDQEHPLTSRVYVNRVWYWLLGQGLVRSVDQFNATGEQPSHPELLDYLARQFQEHDWSVQWLVRTIVLSDAYQRSSDENAGYRKLDPENRWLWRMNRKRLEAECIRDGMLAISGQLDLRRGGSTVRPGTGNDYGYQEQSSRRSLYLPVFRNALPEVLVAFDFAHPGMVVGQRNVSTVPQQALFLLTDPLVHDCASQAAARLLDEQTSAITQEDFEAKWLHAAFMGCLGRPAGEDELMSLRGLLEFEGNMERPTQASLAELYRLLFACLDFRYRD
jgi:mono/diheme cytochrome c family protein